MFSNFLEYFELPQTLVLSNEDLRIQPATVYNEILEFVGVAGPRYSADHAFMTANVTAEKRRITWEKAHRRLLRWHKHNWAPPLHRLFEEEIPKPQLPSEILSFLWSLFEEDMRQFEALVGRAFGYNAPVPSQLSR